MGQGSGEAVDWAAQAEQLTAEFFDAMQRMYIGVGEPALRTVAARNNRLSASNLSALFSGRRTALPNYEVMTAVVDALLHGASAAEREQEHARWKQRWADVRYATKQAKKAKAERDSQAVDLFAEAERVLAQAHAARTAAERDLFESRAKAARVLQEAAYRSAELEAEWHTEVDKRRQSLDRELTEKREQAEAQVNEMVAWAEKVRSDAEVHHGRIIEAARAEAERLRKVAEARALLIVKQARQGAEEDVALLHAQAGQTHSAAQQARDEARRQAADIPRATGDGGTVERAMAAEIAAVQKYGIELTSPFTDHLLAAARGLGVRLGSYMPDPALTVSIQELPNEHESEATSLMPDSDSR